MTANPRSYRIVPSTAVPPQSITTATNDSSIMMLNALMRFLDALKWRQIKNEKKQPDLLVIVPRRSDQMTIEDLIFLRAATGCTRTLVLDIAHRLPSFPPELLSWLNVINNPCFECKNLETWLVKGLSSPPPMTKHSTGKIKEQIGNRVGTASEHDVKGETRFTKRLNDVVVTRIIGHKTTQKLLHAPSLADFYYGLIRLGGKYAVIEHDLNRAVNVLVTSAESRESLAKIGQLRIVRGFVDICQDTLMALRFPLLNHVTKNVRDTILLIDDNPDSIESDIRDIIKDYNLDLTLEVCNPCKQRSTDFAANDNPLWLHEITDYSSITSMNYERPIADKLLLKDVNTKCSCILVDVLFGSKDGIEEEAGIRVIEGMTRILQDARCKTDSLPPILALSRADDLTKVQACLRAGAAGYVLKSRLTSLPAILGRLVHSNVERPDSWHKNFSSLYRLPSETVNLLKSITIPRKDFSRSDNKQKIHECDQVIARLLTAVPKPDLHVHAGSLMRQEFLVVASLVMLLRHKDFDRVKRAAKLLRKFWMGIDARKGLLWLSPHFSVVNGKPFLLEYTHDESGIRRFANKVREWMKKQLEVSMDNASEQQKPRCRSLRAALHHVLGIRDHWQNDRAVKKLYNTPDMLLFTFALAYSGTISVEKPFYPLYCADDTEQRDDVLRLYILHLALIHHPTGKLDKHEIKSILETLFSANQLSLQPDNSWKTWRSLFYDADGHRCSSGSFDSVKVSVQLQPKSVCSILSPCPTFESSPIEYLLATGTRCDCLKDYLEGCELAGAEFLKHPFLIGLYAQQVVHGLVSNGILYAEIRAAISGYECPSIEFTFQKACIAFTDAFSSAQNLVNSLYPFKQYEKKYSAWHWETPMLALDTLFDAPFLNLNRFPAKVGVILTGKRHKPSREMMREAAGAVVMQPKDTGTFRSAQEFVNEFNKSYLVGFDLAGQEDDFPPERFRAEFEQLARLHIPITAHAGENAHAGYIDSAVLDLRARRLGHGLALPEDKSLMRRVREDRVCVELCPVSNFQTSRFVPAGEGSGVKREYPLREFMNNGNAVCLNTDNPVISHTNIIKEYFQASFAYGNPGLSLWDAFRLMRMGFVHAFMSLPERRAILELADQLLYDSFSDSAVNATLRRLKEIQETHVRTT